MVNYIDQVLKCKYVWCICFACWCWTCVHLLDHVRIKNNVLRYLGCHYKYKTSMWPCCIFVRNCTHDSKTIFIKTTFLFLSIVFHCSKRSQSYWWLMAKRPKISVLDMSLKMDKLNNWGWVTHICISKLAIIGSANGFSSCQFHAIIWTKSRILLTRILGTNIREILSKIHTFSFKKMHFNMSSEKWQPFCHGLNVLRRKPHPTGDWVKLMKQ